MNQLKDNEEHFWKSYVSTLPEGDLPKHPNIEAAYAGGIEITDELLALYLQGKKTAGSSIKEDYESSGESLPEIGNYWILLDSNNKPGCLLRTKKVVTHKFLDVPIEIAIAEGEGDLSLDYWRRVHKEIYSPFIKDWGLDKIEDATVVTEFFELVYRGNHVTNIK